MPIPKDIEAEVYFLNTDEGGWSTPAFSHYRPQFFYDGTDWVASLNFPDVEQSNPGDTVRVHIGFMSPEEHFGKIGLGTEFLIREGDRTVATGKVTRIIDLEHSAHHAN